MQDYKEYFDFTPAQSRAIYILILLILLATIFRIVVPKIVRSKETKENNAWINEAMASIILDSSHTNIQSKPTTLTPFTFNPNSLDEQGFLNLGLSERQVQTILNYRNKGGHYYKKEDFKKMYCLREGDYDQLEPYISIPKENYSLKYDSKYLSKNDKNIVVEINSADATQFEKLYGIGEKLAGNIIKQRTKLGGFGSIFQLKEVYGITPETFEKIKTQLKCNITNLKKVNINTATLSEMRQHPVLRENDWALKITQFRKSQDYDIKKLEDLMKIDGMDKETYNKIVPYLSLH